MTENQSWLKFVITGNPKDYLTYKQNIAVKQLNGGDGDAYNDKRPCNKRNEHKG